MAIEQLFSGQHGIQFNPITSVPTYEGTEAPFNTGVYLYDVPTNVCIIAQASQFLNRSETTTHQNQTIVPEIRNRNTHSQLNFERNGLMLAIHAILVLGICILPVK